MRGAERTSLLLSPLGLGASGMDLYFGVSLGIADLEKVRLSQSSLQGKWFSLLTVLALSPHTRDRLCRATHPPAPPELAQGSGNTALAGGYVLCRCVVPSNSHPLGKTPPAPPLCFPGICTIRKIERRLRNRVKKGFQGLAKLQKVFCVGYVAQHV